MFDNFIKFFKKFSKEDNNKDSGKAAKERLHLVLMQDRANVSADFLDMMKQEIIEVIKKYIDVDENSIDVKLTNKVNADGTTGAPALYANIPILNVKDDTKQINIERKLDKEEVKEEKEEPKKEENIEKEEKIEDIEEVKEAEQVIDADKEVVELEEEQKTEETLNIAEKEEEILTSLETKIEEAEQVIEQSKIDNNKTLEENKD